MEEAWRYRPIQNSDICPTCFRLHFPFCSQPPSLHRFPPPRPPPPPSFLHPNADHYPMPVAGPGPFPRPIANPISGDAFVARPPADFSHSWYGNRTPARRGGSFLEEFDERAHKRTRIGVSDFASVERERQLNLIREHGTQGFLHQVSNMDSNQGLEYEMSGQGQRFEEQRIAGGDLRIRSRFDPSGLDSVARARPFLLPGQDATNRENPSPPYVNANDQFLSFPKEENFHSETHKASSAGMLYGNSQDSQYPHARHSHPETPHALAGIGPRNASMGAANYVDPVMRNQDAVTDHGRDRQSMNWSEQGDRHQLDAFAQTSHENFQAFGHQLLHNFLPPQPLYTMQPPVGNMTRFHGQHSDVKPFEPRNLPVPDQPDPLGMPKHSGHSPLTASSNMNYGGTNLGAIHPPAPLPQRPFPKDPPPPYPSHYRSPSPPRASSPLRPIPTSSAVGDMPGPPTRPHFPEFQPSAHSHLYSNPAAHASNGFPAEGSQFVHLALSNQYVGEGHAFQPKHSQTEKPKVINAAHLFQQPHRATRPDHIVVILRGLPGSGKSYLAKILRDLEVENGGNAPRIHSMDDYFMTEIEKVEEADSSKSSGLGKGKKRITKKVMEYCYEPEMEEAYRSSMLKAFKKNLEEGTFTFIIVDDRNLRVADFAQFWATAKRSGYEVYLLEASYKDPTGCAARNVHGFTVEQIQKMAEQWEEAPPMYLRLDVQSLFHGDDLNDSSIQEVDMDMDDGFGDGGLSDVQDRKPIKAIESPSADNVPDGSLKPGEKWAREGELAEAVKELGKSKWSEDLDDDADRKDEDRGNLTALSGLAKAYGKGDKSLRWADEVGKSGFCIGAAKKSKAFSLLIGPGAGYNLDSNPLPEEDLTDAIGSNIGGSKRRSTFLEQLRAERESFRAVFDRRRQRISGLEVEDE